MPHHVHLHHHAPRQEQQDVKVVQETVFVTAAKTFTGPIAGYSTNAEPEPDASPAPVIKGDQSQPAPAPAANTQSPTPRVMGDPANAISATPAASSDNEASAVPTSVQSKAAPKSSDISSSIDTAPTPTDSFSSTPSSIDAGTSAAPTAAGSEQDTPDIGMTSGAKAGLAIGLLALVALLAAAAFFFYRRKQTKDARGEKLDDERTNYNQAAPGLVPRVSVRKSKGGIVAPRLSLRPVTEMFPPEMQEKQAAAAAAAGGLAAPAAIATRSKSPEVTNEKSNPFGDHAKLPEVEDPSLAPKPLNISRPGTPTGSARSEGAPASPGFAAMGAKPPGTPNGQRDSGPLNVHRVQLDFAPSMDDELELRQGQLVRMLHEYDDGWALCIRLDRSQQGVVPRSCISKLPVKPRPAPPPGAQGQGRRGPPPAGAQGRPNPGSPRMRSASNAPNGRPASPAGSQGPFGDGQYRARSNTDNTALKKEYAPSNLSTSPSNSPAGSPTLSQGAMPPRKPVPGQAS